MKRIWSKIPIFLGLCMAWSAMGAVDNKALSETGVLQTIQQAPDPSAVVAAFASGVGSHPTNPKYYEAYVGRMVDLGLPEMAFHQAETLTSFESTNGVAWGVIGYVNARQSRMPEALSAIILAGQFAPDQPF